MDNLHIIVGSGQGGTSQLAAAIRGVGFSVLEVRQLWPRDHYVLHNGVYVRRNVPNQRYNPFGEGGYLREGDGYHLIASCAGVFDTTFSAFEFSGLAGEEKKREANHALITAAQAFFPGTRIHVIPTGKYCGRGHVHLDLSTLLLPQSRLLFIDSHFNHYAATGNDVDSIGKQEGLEVIRYDGSRDGVWYPLNAPVLRRPGEEFVFVDKAASSLISLLRERHLAVIPVDMPTPSSKPSGRLNCMVNVYQTGDNPGDLLEAS